MKYAVLYNPYAGNGKCLNDAKKLDNILTNAEIEYVDMTKISDYKEYFSTLDESVKVIIAGGDGTLNEVFNGIRDYSKVTLGYIPSGSGGDFARDLGISLDPKEALNSILSPKEYKLMDVGNLTNAECNKRFCVSAGIGFDAAVCHEALHSKLKIILNKIIQIFKRYKKNIFFLLFIVSRF